MFDRDPELFIQKKYLSSNSRREKEDKYRYERRLKLAQGNNGDPELNSRSKGNEKSSLSENLEDDL